MHHKLIEFQIDSTRKARMHFACLNAAKIESTHCSYRNGETKQYAQFIHAIDFGSRLEDHLEQKAINEKFKCKWRQLNACVISTVNSQSDTACNRTQTICQYLERHNNYTYSCNFTQTVASRRNFDSKRECGNFYWRKTIWKKNLMKNSSAAAIRASGKRRNSRRKSCGEFSDRITCWLLPRSHTDTSMELILSRFSIDSMEHMRCVRRLTA